MKPVTPPTLSPVRFPEAAALAALRGWYAGLSARQSVARYLEGRRATGQSSRALLTAIRQQLMAYALTRHRADLAVLLDHPANLRQTCAKVVLNTIEALRDLPEPAPLLVDSVTLWLPPRAALALHAAGLHTLADVAPRVMRTRRWWVAVPRLGATSARQVESILAQLPALMLKARALVEPPPSTPVVPWERLVIPIDLDGSEGRFRAPVAGCTLGARTDIAAVNAWLALHETATTVRAYKREAERLVLWALLEREKPISSLIAEDATAYRAFLRHPAPRAMWVGPRRPRASAEWKPFQDELAPRSVAYALSVVNALFRWLKEQNYLLANPFSGLKVKGAGGASELDTSRALTRHEWALVRIEADLMDLRYGWKQPAAERLRFMLDFWLATGLRPSELVGAKLANVERKEGGDSWLHVRGKGDKPAKVALPLLATSSLERYLAQRGLPVSSTWWKPETPLLPSLEEDARGLTTARVWTVLKRFFSQAAEALRESNPALSDKLSRATPHWLRHTHATMALSAGVSLRSVRDNLRHASISTTTLYLAADDVQRARELHQAFGV